MKLYQATKNLCEQLELANSLINSEHPNIDDAIRLAELVMELDRWIQNRGELPRPWLMARLNWTRFSDLK